MVVSGHILTNGNDGCVFCYLNPLTQLAGKFCSLIKEMSLASILKILSNFIATLSLKIVYWSWSKISGGRSLSSFLVSRKFTFLSHPASKSFYLECITDTLFPPGDRSTQIRAVKSGVEIVISLWIISSILILRRPFDTDSSSEERRWDSYWYTGPTQRSISPWIISSILILRRPFDTDTSSE